MANSTSTIPSGWELTTLGDLINIKHGYAFSGEGITDVPTDNILLTPGNFLIGGGWKDGKKYFKGNIPNNYILKKDDLIVTMTDLSKDADTLGYPALIPNDPTKKYLHNQRVGLVTVNEKLASKKYIYFLLRFSDYQRYVVNSATGSTVRHTSPTRIQSFEFSKPQIPEQYAISAILTSLDEKIELLREQNKTLEVTAQSIFKEWFVNFNFPGFTGEIIDSELGKIPKGWRTGKLKELGGEITDYVANGSFASLKENVTLYDSLNFALFLRNTDLKSNFMQKVYVDEHSYNFLKKTQMHGGEIIISNVGDVGSVYLCPFLPTPMVLGNNTISLKSEYQAYFYSLFTNRMGQFLINSITGGSAQPKFNKTDFRNMKMIIPKENVLNRFEAVAWSLYRKMLKNNAHIQSISDLRDALLPKLMKGEVRVKGFDY